MGPLGSRVLTIFTVGVKRKGLRVSYEWASRKAARGRWAVAMRTKWLLGSHLVDCYEPEQRTSCHDTGRSLVCMQVRGQQGLGKDVNIVSSLTP